ncbi:MAG: hypothetical protein ACI8RZ_006340 [Myxococcota bacterium]|jgi:hypothetical protein
MGLLDRLRALVEPDSDSLDRPDLRRRVVDGILKLRRRGQRGVEILPLSVLVTVTVGAGSVEVVRRFVDEPAFDAEIDAELRNRLVGIRPDALPRRRYVVAEGEQTGVVVAESDTGITARLCIRGGDRDGERLILSAGHREHRIGRGEWHEPGTVANDIALGASFVSRRAAVLRVAGSALEVSALDQGECLVVVRRDGKRIRPTNTRSRRVRVGPGDILEFNDGGGQRICVEILSPDEEE